MEPRGATVIITGASSGIGAATSRAFAAAGADVVLVARSQDKLHQLAATLPGNPLVYPADITNTEETRTLIDHVLHKRETIDILINNAGIGVIGPVETLSAHDLQQTFAVNLYGTLFAIQAVIPSMRARKRGHIINVSSVVGMHALPYAGGYAASKAALDRLTEAVRMELQGSGIAVTLVRPGTTQTTFSEKRLGQGREIRRFVPAGVSSETVAQTIVRAAKREPHTAYVTLRDQLQVLLATLLPTPVEYILKRAFHWENTEAGTQNL